MRGFLERVEYPVDIDLSEPEIGAGAYVAITEIGVEHRGHRLAVPLNAEIRDCISGNDSGWQRMGIRKARRMISK